MNGRGHEERALIRGNHGKELNDAWLPSQGRRSHGLGRDTISGLGAPGEEELMRWDGMAHETPGGAGRRFGGGHLEAWGRLSIALRGSPFLQNEFRRIFQGYVGRLRGSELTMNHRQGSGTGVSPDGCHGRYDIQTKGSHSTRSGTKSRSLLLCLIRPRFVPLRALRFLFGSMSPGPSSLASEPEP